LKESYKARTTEQGEKEVLQCYSVAVLQLKGKALSAERKAEKENSEERGAGRKRSAEVLQCCSAAVKRQSAKRRAQSEERKGQGGRE